MTGDEPTTTSPSWESAARTYVSRHIEHELRCHRERITDISSALEDGEDLSVGAIEMTWTTALNHQYSIACALLQVVTDDSHPELSLHGDAYELYQFLSQLIWTRRSASHKPSEGLILDVRDKLQEMDRMLADIPDEEIEFSTDERD